MNTRTNRRKYLENYMSYHHLGPDDILFCVYCGAVAVDLHHRVPRSLGGSDYLDNLEPVCRPCHDKHCNRR